MNSINPTVVEVALPLSSFNTYLYTIPKNTSLKIGQYVLVPFKNRKLAGYVVNFRQEIPKGIMLKDVEAILDPVPLFSSEVLELCKWTSSYYHYPLGKVIRNILPPGYRKIPIKDRPKTEQWAVLKELPQNFKKIGKKGEAVLKRLNQYKELPSTQLKDISPYAPAIVKRLEKKGLVTIEERRIWRDIWGKVIHLSPGLPHLNKYQSAAVTTLTQSLYARCFRAFLLHGIPYSAKIEIYLHLVTEALRLNLTSLVLVPEIDLATEMEGIFRGHFGDRLAIFHSELPRGALFDVWERIRQGRAKVVLGARSAIFTPLENMGVIIVDEEQDDSYKQERGIRYHARDLALVRAKKSHCLLILNSFAPSLTSFYHALSGKYHYLSLREEVTGLHRLHILDMRKESLIKPYLSKFLIKRIKDHLVKKHQILLFLNRRGFASFVLCPDCGYVFRCPNCAVGLTYHLKEKRLICHYCGYAIPAPAICPNCKGFNVKPLGLGTERLEKELRSLLPRAHIKRLDSDVARKKGECLKILKEFYEGEIDILIGTQMVVGQRFPRIGLVGIILADISINIPDFLAAERTFQILNQVIGGGRGEVVVQTYNPNHYALNFLKKGTLDFYFKESALRKRLLYPPFSRLINLRFEGNSSEVVKECAHRTADISYNLKKEPQYQDIHILGPAEAPLFKLKGRYRWQLLLRAERAKILHKFCKDLMDRVKCSSRVRFVIDVDPINII